MDVRWHHWLVALMGAGLAHGALLLLLFDPPRAAPRAVPVARLHLTLSAAPPPAAAAPEPAPPAAVSAAASSVPAETVAPPMPAPPPAIAAAPPRTVGSRPPKPRPALRASRAARVPAARPGRSGALDPSVVSRGSADSDHARAAGGTDRASAGARTTADDEAREAHQHYVGTLHAWLARHQRYPESARRRQEEGTVTLEFTIDRQGRVVSQRVLASSGFPLLDRAATALLEQAAPLPPMPAALVGNTLTLRLPIRFDLR